MVFSPRLDTSETTEISYYHLHLSHTLWNSLVFHSFLPAIMSLLTHKCFGSWPVSWESKITTLIKASIRCLVTEGIKKLIYYWLGILLSYWRITCVWTWRIRDHSGWAYTSYVKHELLPFPSSWHHCTLPLDFLYSYFIASILLLLFLFVWLIVLFNFIAQVELIWPSCVDKSDQREH